MVGIASFLSFGAGVAQGMQVGGFGCLATGAANLVVGAVRRYQPDEGADSRLPDQQPDPEDHTPFLDPRAQGACVRYTRPAKIHPASADS